MFVYKEDKKNLVRDGYFIAILIKQTRLISTVSDHRCTQGGPGGGEEGGTSCSPSKDFEKLDQKNAVKLKNRGPIPRFSHNPKDPPQKNLKMTAHLCQ
jgi:hypothetical protein